MAEIKDSGKRRSFGTGSVRDVAEGKGRFDLIDWETVWEDSIHFEKGSKKYGDRNWEKGQPLSVYFNSAVRHLAKYALGWTDEPHLDAARWNLHCLTATKRWIDRGILPKSLDDFPIIRRKASNGKQNQDVRNVHGGARGARRVLRGGLATVNGRVRRTARRSGGARSRRAVGVRRSGRRR